MVDSSAGACFQVRLEFFSLSSKHAKVARERLFFFYIVSKHSVLILYFMK